MLTDQHVASMIDATQRGELPRMQRKLESLEVGPLGLPRRWWYTWG